MNIINKLSGAFVLALLCQPAIAAPIFADSYSMQNGQTGTYTYFDESYNGTGNISGSLSSLSGGTGDLTDGVIATTNWNVAEQTANGPYVGWVSINPMIQFLFGDNVVITSVTIFVDDPNGFGGVVNPASFDFGLSGQSLSNMVTPDAASATPTSFTMSGLNVTGTSFDLRINKASSNAWVFLSEVQFEGYKVSEPSTLAILALGLIGLGALASKSKFNNFF